MVFLFGAVSVSAANYGLSETAGQTSYKTNDTPSGIATKAINAVLAVVYIIFFVLVLYAGVRWMTAQGNEDNVTKAKNILEAAIIGAILISAAYAVTSFVLGKVGAGGGAGNQNQDAGVVVPEGMLLNACCIIEEGVCNAVSCSAQTECETKCTAVKAKYTVIGSDCNDNYSGDVYNTCKP